MSEIIIPNETLENYGLNRFYHSAAVSPDGPCLGRVVNRQANRYEIVTSHGRLWAELSGRLSYTAATETDLPVVGDWVRAWWDHPGKADEIGLILELCPRESELKRQAPGGSGDCQILAANVQSLVIVWPLDKVETEKTAHRPQGHLAYVRWGMVQRFITMAHGGGIQPILVLSKADLLAPGLQTDVRAQAVERWPDMPILVIGEADQGINRPEDLLALLPEASTAVLVGLSGAGKSTLINRLDSRVQAQVQTISESVRKGRHTTSHRELYRLPQGALLVDSPGIRELGVWVDRADLESSFSNLAELAQSCRFADCRHGNEPGCTVNAALSDGRLEPGILEQYRKQQAELAWLAARQLQSNLKNGTPLSAKEFQEATIDQRKWKQIAKFQKQSPNKRGNA